MSEYEAGPQLDAVVHVRIFGEPVKESTAGGIWTSRGLPIPPYSTDIGAAWRVLEHLQAADWGVDITDDLRRHWTVTLIPPSGRRPDSEAVGASAPLAICIAALQTVGGGV